MRTLALLSCLAAASLAFAADTPPTTSPLAWTDADANAQLKLNPRDAYLQYLVMQLGHRRGEDRYRDVRNITGVQTPFQERTDQLDLLSLFGGAQAIQESLQLDAMRPREAEAHKQTDEKLVDLTTLHGPEVKSHPWEQMLGDRKPDVAGLALCVPADFYFLRFNSLSKLLDLSDAAGVWAKKLAGEGFGSALAVDVDLRVRHQLALKVDPLLRPFYDEVVGEVAVTGSDPFVREGSDVTMLFRLKEPELFLARSAVLIAETRQGHPDARDDNGSVDGIPYQGVVSPDRSLCVYTADPAPDLHVRSNSKAALAHVIDAMKGGGLKSLGNTAEFKYVRTLMPQGAAEEDGLLYLSDPFVRNLVGPRLKLAERRRLVCYNHLRMAGHATTMFRTEYGRDARTMQELADLRCAPGVIGESPLACPDGGKLTFLPDGTAACSVHGRVNDLIPNLDLPLDHITQDEAALYQQFVQQYNQYWRRYFDPIAVRIQVTPERLRFETIVLPLIDNSIYTGMATLMKGKPAALDALPKPKGDIFGVAVKVNPEESLRQVTQLRRESGFVAREIFGVDATSLPWERLVAQGLTGEVALHAIDAPQAFGLDLLSFFGRTGAEFNGSASAQWDPEFLVAGLMAASLHSPLYMAMPVRDPKVVDEFLAQLDEKLGAVARHGAERNFLDLDRDFYRLPGPTGARCSVLRVGPVSVRLYWARIGDALYLASKSSILDEIAAAQAHPSTQPAATPDDKGNATAQIRADRFHDVLPEYQAAWEEQNRHACLDALSQLSDVARALTASTGQPPTIADVARQAHATYGTHLTCPDGGEHRLSHDGKSVTCSLHGSAAQPTQLLQPAGDAGQLYGTNGVRATLTFLEDGLHAVIVVDRK